MNWYKPLWPTVEVGISPCPDQHPCKVSVSMVAGEREVFHRSWMERFGVNAGVVSKTHDYLANIVSLCNFVNPEIPSHFHTQLWVNKETLF